MSARSHILGAVAQLDVRSSAEGPAVMMLIGQDAENPGRWARRYLRTLRKEGGYQSVV